MHRQANGSWLAGPLFLRSQKGLMWSDQSHTVKPWLVGLCKLCDVNGAIESLRVKGTPSQWEVIWGNSLLGGLWVTYGDMCGCHTWGAQHGVGRPEIGSSTLQNPGCSTENDQAHCLQCQEKGHPSYRTETLLFLLVCVCSDAHTHLHVQR